MMLFVNGKAKFLPLNDLGQLADHYCHWFLELSFSRISESTTGNTITPCVGFYIRYRDHWVFLLSDKCRICYSGQIFY